MCLLDHLDHLDRLDPAPTYVDLRGRWQAHVNDAGAAPPTPTTDKEVAKHKNTVMAGEIVFCIQN